MRRTWPELAAYPAFPRPGVLRRNRKCSRGRMGLSTLRAKDARGGEYCIASLSHLIDGAHLASPLSRVGGHSIRGFSGGTAFHITPGGTSPARAARGKSGCPASALGQTAGGGPCSLPAASPSRASGAPPASPHSESVCLPAPGRGSRSTPATEGPCARFGFRSQPVPALTWRGLWLPFQGWGLCQRPAAGASLPDFPPYPHPLSIPPVLYPTPTPISHNWHLRSSI